jgi:hypothetical protein
MPMPSAWKTRCVRSVKCEGGGVEAHLAVLIAPDEADREAASELAACCLIANAAVEARA